VNGRTVLVVGGSGGLGSAVSRLMAGNGARVVIADRDSPAARRIVEQLDARFVGVDLEAIADTAAALRDALPEVDGVVDAAGVASTQTTGNVTLAQWDHVLRVNLAAPFFVCQALADRVAHGGAMVNISSIEAHVALATSGATTPAYAASKAGLELVTRCLAADLRGRGIRVNAVAPGFIRTAMTAAHELAHGDWVARRTPLGRWAEASDVAAVVGFLLSDGARFMTGTTVVVDGGLTSTLIRPESPSQ